MSIRDLFNEMKKLTETSDKFFMNISEYRGKRTAMFDYSLTIPADFSSQAALECRGSLFEVDENNEYVDILCRPYEKFLNLHEYDYDNSETLHKNISNLYDINVASSEDIKNLEVAYALNKEDGSIISAFDFDGELDCKSNSSLTSTYKDFGMRILKNDMHLYDKTDTLTSQNYTVCFEYLSDNPQYQIVLRHDTERLVVTGVRHNETGEYLTYDQLVDHFGADHVTQKIATWDWSDVDTRDDIEGYVLVLACGLRIKLKTSWYVENHKIRDNFMTTPRHFWEYFVEGKTDDLFLVVENSVVLREHFNYLLEKSNDLFTSIVHEGETFYNTHKDLDRKDFFREWSKNKFGRFPAKSYAAKIYTDGHESAMDELKRVLLIRKTISELGIVEW